LVNKERLAVSVMRALSPCSLPIARGRNRFFQVAVNPYAVAGALSLPKSQFFVLLYGCLLQI
jgi:hypothetical protein